MVKASITYKDDSPEVLEGIDKNLADAVGKSLIVLQGNIIKNTPIRHGTLARSITVRMHTPFDGEVYTAPLADGGEITYAIFVEYGTRYMAPRAMFRKGVAQSEQRVNEIFSEELNKK